MSKKIAICGYSSTLNQAPFKDESWDIYTMNHQTSYYKRSTLHFDLHDIRKLSETDKYYNFIQNNKDKSILTGIDKRFKEATIYPKEDIINKYSDFFTCSAAWMIAYAIEQNPSDIGIYGIDCAYKEEYINQKPSIIKIIKIAEEKNINMHYPKDCKLFNGINDMIYPKEYKVYWNNCGIIRT